MHGSSTLLLRFSVKAGTLLRRKPGLWESLFITFGDQCVFLWQQAECWDTWDPPCALHTAIILPAVLTAVVMEAEHTPWWGEVSNKPIDWLGPITLCCELNWHRRPSWWLYQKPSLQAEDIPFNTTCVRRRGSVCLGDFIILSRIIQQFHVLKMKKGNSRMIPVWLGQAEVESTVEINGFFWVLTKLYLGVISLHSQWLKNPADNWNIIQLSWQTCHLKPRIWSPCVELYHLPPVLQQNR